MGRALALAAAIVVSLLAVTGAGGGQQTPRRGGTVYVAWPGPEPPCLNLLVEPCRAFNLPITDVIEGAFKLAPDYSWRPDLVRRVEYTTKPPFTLTYHIRPEARWSDGVTVTASDFVFTYRARLAHPLPEDDLNKTWIRSVRAVDPKTVRVVLRARYAFWRGLFDVVLPAHALRSEDLSETWIDRIDNPKTGAPIGSGPLLVQSWQRGRQVTLVRNPKYWGPHPAYLDRVIVRFYSSVLPLDPGVADLFRTGEADVGTWQFTEDLVSALGRVSGIGLRFAPDAPGWEHLDFREGRGGHPALRNKLVRRALAYGIDRVAIARVLLGSTGRVIRPLDSAVFRSADHFYRPNWSIYRYDPAHARRLLEQAGCRVGADAIYSCGGERLALRFVSRGNPDRRVRTLELIQAQLRQAGVEVVPVYVTSSSHDQILESGDFDVTLFAWFSPAAEGGGIKSLYGCGGESNYTGYCQRLETRDLDESDRILDRKSWRVLNRADVRLVRDVPVIPLFELPSVSAVRSTVHNYVANLTDATWNAENWWLEH